MDYSLSYLRVPMWFGLTYIYIYIQQLSTELDVMFSLYKTNTLDIFNKQHISCKSKLQLLLHFY